MSRVEDHVPGRRGWTFGSWERDRGEFLVPVFHRASGVGVWAHGCTREDVVIDAQSKIDEVYVVRWQTYADAEPIVESVILRP